LGPYDVFALQEVRPSTAPRYAAAIRKAHGNYRYVTSITGRSTRLLIVYNADRLELQNFQELFVFDGMLLNDWNHRSPLVAEFRAPDTGTRFKVLNIHLARGKAKLRQEQARGLREWAKAQTLPVVAIGDFNFDYDYLTQKGNMAFGEFVAGDVWRWVRPEELIDTNWSDRDGDGVDNYPDSCLDFAFVAGIAKNWGAESRVIVRERDFPDDDKTADHRPVELGISP
jgi:endonuclease/exonuclease/phosphatase family metal-dependent hydrolase